jgi:hypothetical protein
MADEHGATGGAKHEAKQAESSATAPRDWLALRAKFAAGVLTTRDFAKAEGIPYPTIARQAAANGWDDARKAFRTKAAAKVESKALKHRIATEEVIDGTAHRAALRFARAARNALQAAEKVTLDDAPKLKALVETLEKAHRLARVTAHLPAEPVPAAAAPKAMTVIIRGLDEHGETVDEHAGSHGEAGGGPAELPADAVAGEVPAQP